jgi:type II secretory pathway pseudopilin PulG
MVEIENTKHTVVNEKKPRKPKKKFFERRSAWFLIAAILVVIILAVGAMTGVARGINDRISLAERQAAPRIQSQIDGARLDIEEGRYEVALSRLDWILDEMTDFLTEEELAEIGELYSQTLLLISSRTTPTPQPSPTPTEPVFTPTPDLRGAQELYDTALQQISAGAWDDAIRTIEALREKDLYFRAVQVDGLLFIALRNRGIQKILAEGSLEPGIFDLTLAERFAPLDSRAEGLRTWTRFYLTGASFWDVDWSQVVFYFEQVYPHLPNLRDGTFMTATERYRIGAIEYATQLAAAGEFCLAQEYYEKALAISEDASVRTMSQDAAEACLSGSAPPQPPQTDALTPTPVEGTTPTPGPTQEPTQDQTEVPPEEPTPTVAPTEE